MMICKPKRIHPVGVILTFIKNLKDLIIPAVIFIFVGSNGIMKTIGVYGFPLLILVIIISSFISWWKFTYRIEDGEVRIEHGLLFRKKRYIPIERIQTINVSAGLVQQLFGLVKVEIETAGGGVEAEVALAAIRKNEADLIKEAVALSKKEKGNEIDHSEEQIVEEKGFQMSVKDLLIMGSTSSGIGVVLSAGFALFSQIDDFISFEKIFGHIHFLENASVTIFIVLGLIVLIIAWILSMIGVVLKYAFFTVKKVNNDLVITRGLIEKHQFIIPKERIQAIRISENIIRQLLGYATVYIESAGGNIKNEQSFSTMLFPIAKTKHISQLLNEFTPDFVMSDHIYLLPKRSMRRYVMRAVIPSIIISTLLCVFLQPWGYVSLILVPLSGLYGYLSYKAAGWNVAGSQLSIRYRKLSKVTVLVHKKRMQIFENKTSLFQKRADLQTISTTIKAGLGGSQYSLKDIEAEDGEKLANWYRQKE